MVVSGTIGWLKVMLTKGAIPTSPSGCTRSTVSGPGSTSGAAMSGPAGNGRSMISPVRGGGSDSGGRLNSVASLSSTVPSHGGSRLVTARISAASSGLPSTRLAAGELRPPIASPSLRRTVNNVPRSEPSEPSKPRAAATGASVGALPDPSPPLPGADLGARPGSRPAPGQSEPPSPEQAPASSATTIPTMRQRLRCARMDRRPS